MTDDYPIATWIRSEDPPELASYVFDVPHQDRAVRPYRITATWTYEARPNGFPVRGGVDLIDRLENRLFAQLQSIGAIWLGHTYGCGSVSVTFAARERAPDLLMVRRGLLSKVSIKLTSHHDPDWDHYRMELEPSEMQRRWSIYQPLLMMLAKDGDVAEKPRPVDFNLDFPNEAAFRAALPELELAGFAHANDWEMPAGGWAAEMVKETAITMEALYPQIELIEGIAVKHGGTLDGWASPVAK